MSDEKQRRGPLAERPAADSVPAGFLWECDDSPARYRSDGQQWWDASAETDGWHLAYAEDLHVGAQVRRVAEIPTAQQRQQQAQQFGGLIAVVTGMGCGHLHLPEWVIIAERREAGDLIACIGVRPNGEQTPLYLGRLEMVQVKTEDPT